MGWRRGMGLSLPPLTRPSTMAMPWPWKMLDISNNRPATMVTCLKMCYMTWVWYKKTGGGALAAASDQALNDCDALAMEHAGHLE